MDSVIVLHWLHASNKEQSLFVANRIVEILETSTIDEWRFVNGKLKPADIGSRGMTISELNDSEWINGPAWLKSDGSEWPVQPKVFEPGENKTEIASLSAEFNLHSRILLDWSQYSSFNQLINIIEKCLRFSKLKRVTIADRHKLAEIKVLKMIQTDAFQSEQAAIQNSQIVVPNSKFRKAAPFLDSDGLIRAKGRLKHSELRFDKKHPIILPANHIAVRIFLEREQKANNHERTEYVRSMIQQKYWVIGLRNLLRRIKLNCVLCRKRYVRVFQTQMADLPSDCLYATFIHLRTQALIIWGLWK